MKSIRYYLLPVAMLMLMGCSVSKKAPVDPAAPPTDNVPAPANYSSALNGEWELNYIAGPKITFSGLYPDKKPVLIFILPKTEVNGHTSCNPFSLNIAINGHTIAFAAPRSTMMACEGSGESTFLATLKKINAYSVDDTSLTLLTGDVAMMRFTKK